ncbi:siroheme synthase [Calocera viscosa TUFC12733]|uniref:precorrin-2 dehydrogenase n=1 Tax=Calocera viscosa (strain TUFC12733) TaxID=1330018 RepID=A0A167M2Q4_CALVF|nr:siroheme synthase [Calocera viscosa TUFC12733]
MPPRLDPADMKVIQLYATGGEVDASDLSPEIDPSDDSISLPTNHVNGTTSNRVNGTTSNRVNGTTSSHVNGTTNRVNGTMSSASLSSASELTASISLASEFTAPDLPFPPLWPGGSLLLAWQLRAKRVLLIGGGAVAAGRLTNVLEADALVSLVSPANGLCAEVEYRIFHDPWARNRITYYDRAWFGEHDLDLDGGIDMVLSAVDDAAVSREVCQAARRRKIPVNVADVPPECDFYFGSQIRDGPLQVLVSTGGKGPKIANIVRRKIEVNLPRNCGQAIERVGELRRRLRVRAPGVGGEMGRRRMQWMVEVCDRWELEDLAQLEDADMDRLLDEGWEKGHVLSPEDVGKKTAANEEVKSFVGELSWNREGLASVLGATLGAAIVALVVFATKARTSK